MEMKYVYSTSAGGSSKVGSVAADDVVPEAKRARQPEVWSKLPWRFRKSAERKQTLVRRNDR